MAERRKLTRITIGNIANLVDETKVVDIGIGEIIGEELGRAPYRHFYIITSEREINFKDIPPFKIEIIEDRASFLRGVDIVLASEGLYFSDVNYKKRGWNGSQILEGNFYREKEAQKRVVDLPEEGDSVDG